MMPIPIRGPRHRAAVALQEPAQALQGYLQALLDEVPPEPEPKRISLEAPPVLRPTEPLPRPASDLQVPASSRHPASRGEATGPLTRPLPGGSVDVAGPRPPEWAGGPFQVLLFRCGGMRLGIPLTALRALVCLARAPTRLPGLPAWHLGVCLARGGKVGVADLGRLLRPGSDGAAQGANNYVLLLAHGPWGLACESLGSAQRVEPQAVRWRRDGSRAPLIQGVIRESLTPLLSAEAILASIGA